MTNNSTLGEKTVRRSIFSGNEGNQRPGRNIGQKCARKTKEHRRNSQRIVYYKRTTQTSQRSQVIVQGERQGNMTALSRNLTARSG